MEAAAGVNVYLNATEPWKTVKDDPDRTATTLFVALQAISGLRTAFAPYLPFSTESLGQMRSSLHSTGGHAPRSPQEPLSRRPSRCSGRSSELEE